VSAGPEPRESELDESQLAAVARATEVLRRGGLVAIPTETVYGLAADASNEAAVRRIFAVKGRPADHPLIVHVADARQIDDWAVEVPETARVLARAFWPGPLTLLLPRGPRVLDVVTGGRPTIGLRVPAHPLTAALLASFGAGIAAPSANRFGRVSPTAAAHVLADLGDDVDLVLDGGPCTIGVESTIVDCTLDPPMILRPGAITAEQLDAALGSAVSRHASGPARAPGMIAAHYAPRARVELVADDEDAERALAAHRLSGLTAGRLDAPSDLDDVARRLYAALRGADDAHLDVLVVVLAPEAGIGVAINDRLRRAATGSALRQRDG
jgi:L-threonylcarbamoyladenylate synthase